MSINLGAGVTVQVDRPPLPEIAVQRPVRSDVIAFAVAGPPGPAGPPGDDATAPVDWFVGDGPPGSNGPVIGSSLGDMYIDQLTGTLYQLR